MNSASLKSAPRHLHLPLSPALHADLLVAAERERRPATALVREAIEEWLEKKRRLRLREEIATYAVAVAGSSDDLDKALERGGLDLLVAKKPRRKTR